MSSNRLEEIEADNERINMNIRICNIVIETQEKFGSKATPEVINVLNIVEKTLGELPQDFVEMRSRFENRLKDME